MDNAGRLRAKISFIERELAKISDEYERRDPDLSDFSVPDVDISEDLDTRAYWRCVNLIYADTDIPVVGHYVPIFARVLATYSREQVKAVEGVGPKTLALIEEALNQYGLKLGCVDAEALFDSVSSAPAGGWGAVLPVFDGDKFAAICWYGG